MLTPTHSFFDTLIYFGLNYFGIIKFRYFDLIALYSAGLRGNLTRVGAEIVHIVDEFYKSGEKCAQNMSY